VSAGSGENHVVLTYVLLILPVLFVLGIAVAIKRQSAVTRSLSAEHRAHDTQVYNESTRMMEATVAEALAEKARDPRLASMTQEDLVYECQNVHDIARLSISRHHQRRYQGQAYGGRVSGSKGRSGVGTGLVTAAHIRSRPKGSGYLKLR
jgi:hypothetical protein